MLTPGMLLAGPRGRYLLLKLAVQMEIAQLSQAGVIEFIPENSPTRKIIDASYQLDPGRGVSVVRIPLGGDDSTVPAVSPDEVVQRLDALQLIEITPSLLRNSMQQTVQMAMYWQPPSGEDVLAATSPVRSALLRIAEHVIASPHTAWWSSPIARDDQWSIRFDGRHWSYSDEPGWDDLAAWSTQRQEKEERSRRTKSTDPAGPRSDVWWSIPPMTLPHTSRRLVDGSPAGLWFVEDGASPKVATATLLHVASNANVYEIHTADDWAELCRRFPVEVTAQSRQDWYRTTGRNGRWVIPDWTQLAREYDGVHLTVAAYLSAAGSAIPVDTETCSVIAGWDLDTTWWLRDVISAAESTRWVYELAPEMQYRWRQVKSGD